MGNGDPTTARRVAVIGLGRFGESVATNLAALGYEVTAIDIDERRVAEIADRVTLAAQGDGADEEMLRSLAVDRSQVAIVGQGENLEASVLSTLVLKRLRVPWVIAKAESNLHGELLSRIGANRVVYPERDAGVRVAHSLTIHNLEDYISLSATTGIARLAAPPGSVGTTIGALTAGAGIDVLLLERGNRWQASPGPTETLRAGDILVVAGADAAIDAFAAGVAPA